jgi:hypothetical protein
MEYESFWTRFELGFNGKKLMITPVEVKWYISYSEIPSEEG